MTNHYLDKFLKKRNITTSYAMHGDAMHGDAMHGGAPPDEGASPESTSPEGVENVIPNGVKIPVREETNLVPKIQKTLLFLSRIHVKKGIDILLDAWSELHEQTKMDNWTLKVVGFLDEEQNDYEKYILNKIAIFPTLSNVRTSEGKFGDEMWDEFFLSDAFVLPTFSEGSAMVVLNGWTAGKICVTTIGSNLEYGLDEKCTILVEPNIESLKVGILRLISMDDDNLKVYGKVGKEVVLRNYTWEKIVDQHVEIYKKTIKR